MKVIACNHGNWNNLNEMLHEILKQAIVNIMLFNTNTVI